MRSFDADRAQRKAKERAANFSHKHANKNRCNLRICYLITSTKKKPYPFTGF